MVLPENSIEAGQKKRLKFLKIWLLIVVVLNVILIISIIINRPLLTLDMPTGWQIYFSLVSSLIIIMSALAVYKLKILGVWAIWACSAVSILLAYIHAGFFIAQFGFLSLTESTVINTVLNMGGDHKLWHKLT